MSREKNKELGVQAEQRLMLYLCKKGYDCLEGVGRGEDPDLILWVRSSLYGIEVKSTVPYSSGRCGGISITLNQWNNLKRWCETEGAEPMLIVEIKPRGRDPLYFRINPALIDKQFSEKRHTTFASFTLWQIIERGHKI